MSKKKIHILVYPFPYVLEACHLILSVEACGKLWFPTEWEDVAKDTLAKRVEMFLLNSGWIARVMRNNTLLISGYKGNERPPSWLGECINCAQVGGWVRWQGGVLWTRMAGMTYTFKKADSMDEVDTVSQEGEGEDDHL